jgi:Xaa-Pro aminopeptidase
MTTKFLNKLRCLMKEKSLLLKGDKLEAYIVPSSDAHGSEYLNDKDKRRSFISGFTGF